MKDNKFISLSIKYADTIKEDVSALQLFGCDRTINDIFSDFYLDKDHEYLAPYRLTNISSIKVFKQYFILNQSLLKEIPKDWIFLGQYDKDIAVFFNEHISAAGFKHLLFFNIKKI